MKTQDFSGQIPALFLHVTKPQFLFGQCPNYKGLETRLECQYPRIDFGLPPDSDVTHLTMKRASCANNVGKRNLHIFVGLYRNKRNKRLRFW